MSFEDALAELEARAECAKELGDWHLFYELLEDKLLIYSHLTLKLDLLSFEIRPQQ